MEYSVYTLVTLYMVIMSIVGFVTMVIDKKRSMDKRKSIKRGWRIPERTLLLIAFMGGALGS
ncbi:MAG: DUF1294 domain-containing protein, partial [Anaerolineaceae bacterium]